MAHSPTLFASRKERLPTQMVIQPLLQKTSLPIELKNEVEALYELGVGCDDLNYLVFLKVKKEIIVCEE